MRFFERLAFDVMLGDGSSCTSCICHILLSYMIHPYIVVLDCNSSTTKSWRHIKKDVHAKYCLLFAHLLRKLELALCMLHALHPVCNMD
jgi:hypothetical protein